MPSTLKLGAYAIGKDFKILDSNYIDNIIGIAALIFGIVSIPRVKEWLGRRLSESVYSI